MLGLWRWHMNMLATALPSALSPQPGQNLLDCLVAVPSRQMAKTLPFATTVLLQRFYLFTDIGLHRDRSSRTLPGKAAFRFLQHQPPFVSRSLNEALSLRLRLGQPPLAIALDFQNGPDFSRLTSAWNYTDNTDCSLKRI
jgi:hypothetical protein